jgi:hypothetical protein
MPNVLPLRADTIPVTRSLATAEAVPSTNTCEAAKVTLEVSVAWAVSTLVVVVGAVVDDVVGVVAGVVDVVVGVVGAGAGVGIGVVAAEVTVSVPNTVVTVLAGTAASCD